MIVSLAAVVFIWVVALPIGIYSAVRQYSIGDYFFTFVGFIGIAIPNFMLALIVLYVSFKYFDVQNIGGLFSPDMVLEPWGLPKLVDMLKHLPLPAVIIGMAGMAEVVRIMRANLLDELRRPYVVTARAKGLAEMRVIMKYPVRAAMNPFASTIGYLFPFLVSGSIIVSLVLSLPTVGPLLYKSLIAQDLFLAGTILLLLASPDRCRHLHLGPDPDVDRPAYSPRHGGKPVMAEAVGTLIISRCTPIATGTTEHRRRRQDLCGHTVAAHVVALSQAQVGHGSSGDHLSLLWRLSSLPISLPTPTRSRTMLNCSCYRRSRFIGLTKANFVPMWRALRASATPRHLRKSIHPTQTSKIYLHALCRGL